VQVLVGLFPDIGIMLRSKCAESASGASGIQLYDELTTALHTVVLGIDDACASDTLPEESGDSHACTLQLLKTLLEVVGQLRPQDNDVDVLGSAFRRPSLCALLVETPSPTSLHLPCLQLLQALLKSTELFAVAHGTQGHENPLLAAANLLVIPTVEPHSCDGAKGGDSPELQDCRISALEVVCRCLASAPSLEIVLGLRGHPTPAGQTFETVLQRVVFLCHHELLCLGIHGVDGDAWHDQSLQECAERRQRAIELSLMIMSSFVWHAAPDVYAPNHATSCSECCEALGRMRPLVASIVDMVVRRASCSSYYTRLLGSASALRVLLAHADGHDGCTASGDGGVAPACKPATTGTAGIGVGSMMILD